MSQIIVDRQTRKPISNYSIRMETAPTSQHAVITAAVSSVDACQSYASPAPTYSATNNKAVGLDLHL